MRRQQDHDLEIAALEYIYPVTTPFAEQIETAKRLKEKLKQTFPTVKFQAHSSKVGSIELRWVDGPLREEVEQAVAVGGFGFQVSCCRSTAEAEARVAQRLKDWRERRKRERAKRNTLIEDQVMGIAKRVRKKLRETFPTIKFQVHSQFGSPRSAIDVRWMEGPLPAEVEQTLREFRNDRLCVFCSKFFY
jgi:hypothetical protein